MTQSKKSEDTFTINLDNMDTTTYWAGGIMTDTITISDNTSSAYTINDDSIDLSNITSLSWPPNNTINPDEVERMCKEYPALEKTWRNFKATYDLVKQDWKGKQDDDDEFPF